MDERTMNILRTSIPYDSDYCEISELRFLHDNPRVYACTHGKPEFARLHEAAQQDLIFAELQKQPGFDALKQDIVRHGGLIEPILIRLDRKEVVEGNTRLAAYRVLAAEEAPGEWGLIPCNMVKGLTDDQQAAFLNQIHVTGKTQWSAYEKANFAYVRVQAGIAVPRLADLFGESVNAVGKRVAVVKLMADNTDPDLSHFSHYDVLVRRRPIAHELDRNEALRALLLRRIRSLGTESEIDPFSAQDLRDKLPTIIDKKRVLRRFVKEEYGLDEAYQVAKISRVEEHVRRARSLLTAVGKQDVDRVEQNRIGALGQDVRRLGRDVERINAWVKVRRER